jgi:hypothetical protein
MSEGKLAILVASRDSSGRIVSSTYTEVGLPVVVSTLVGATIDSQLLNRASTLEIDESDVQTGRITHHKLERWTNMSGEDEEAASKSIQSIDKQCKRLGPLVKEIKIPFAMQLEESLPKVLTMRRGIDRLLSLVGAIAFVKWALGMRPDVELKGQGNQSVCIVALPEDLSDLYCLGEAFQDSLTYFLARAKRVYDIVHMNGGGSTEDVARVLELSQSRAREYLNHLVKLGYATRTKEKGTYRYKAEPHDTNPIKLQATYTETDLKHWFQQQFPNGNAELHIPQEAKTGFQSPPPVVVGRGFESGLGAAERTG